MMAKHESASVLAVKMLALLHAIARSPAMHAAPRITACCHGRAHRVVAGLTGPRLLSCLSYATVSKWKHRYRRTSSVADISAGASTPDSVCESGTSCSVVHRILIGVPQHGIVITLR